MNNCTAKHAEWDFYGGTTCVAPAVLDPMYEMEYSSLYTNVSCIALQVPLGIYSISLHVTPAKPV